LVLEDDTGKAQQVNQEAVAELFEILKDNVRIIVFNACFTKDQARALSGFIDFTVGTNEAVGDRASIAFAAAFYRGLAYGRSVREAFKLGKLELKLLGISGEEKTEFFVREGANPDKPFLPLKGQENPDQVASSEKLESALAHLLAGSANEDEKRIVRRELIDGAIVLEQIEGAPESDVEVLKALDYVG